MALVFWDTLRLGAVGRHWSARGRLRFRFHKIQFQSRESVPVSRNPVSPFSARPVFQCLIKDNRYMGYAVCGPCYMQGLARYAV